MKTINISTKTLKKLERYNLQKINNIEAKFYFFPGKDRWNKQMNLLKIFYNKSGSTFSNKMYTINELIENSDTIGIDELIMPQRLVIINGEICGCLIPFIENINFKLILDDLNVPIKEKIEMFKQIGEILDKMKKIRENTNIKDFFLNDMHEANFILNAKSKKINVVDMDSCKINENRPFASKYLTPFSNISTMPFKYIQNHDTSFSGYIIANQNSDYYCYIIMILNYLYGDNVSNMKTAEFYSYLNYLRSIGLSYKLLDRFSKIYEYGDNENIKDYLDYINSDIVHKAKKQIYELKK